LSGDFVGKIALVLVLEDREIEKGLEVFGGSMAGTPERPGESADGIIVLGPIETQEPCAVRMYKAEGKWIMIRNLMWRNLPKLVAALQPCSQRLSTDDGYCQQWAA